MKHKFQVGDKCRIRQFEDMAAEFGVDQYGEIEKAPSFVENMKPMCGLTFTVKEVKDGMYYSIEGVEDSRGNGNVWNIAGWMLEPADEHPDEPIEAPDFLAFLA